VKFYEVIFREHVAYRFVVAAPDRETASLWAETNQAEICGSNTARQTVEERGCEELREITLGDTGVVDVPLAVSRVVIDSDGGAVPSEHTQIQPTVVYIRDDGWSLGAPEHFRSVAFAMWRDKWVAMLTWDGYKWLYRRLSRVEASL